MSGANATYICTPDDRAGPRDDCPNDVHDWPLPAQYTGAAEMAEHRLERGWTNARCPDCGLHGWVPGELRDGDVQVSIIHQPKRIRLSRRSGWRKPETAIVVARPSRWGNPFTVEEYGRTGAIDKYRTWIEGRIHDGHANLTELTGRDLACWCPLDEPCHADVLLELANREAHDRDTADQE